MNENRTCVFPNGTLKYVELHCNNDFSLYTDPPEIDNVRKYFENKSPRNVLELGCGLGRSSVGFYNVFPSWEKTNFFLLDGDSGEKQIAFIRTNGYKDFYNDLKLTKEFCLWNGISKDQIRILNAEELDPFLSVEDIKFDFVYSFLAIGFHWPISLYLEKLLPYLYSNSILCFGIRSFKFLKDQKFNDNQINNISNNFEILEVIKKGSQDSLLVLRKT